MGAIVLGSWLIVSGMVGQAPDEAAVKKELAKFEGAWRYDSMEMDGKSIPLVGFEDARLTIKGKDFVSKEVGATHKGTFSLDLAKKPKTIDVIFSEGPEAGKVYKGIYELDGDTYKVCMAVPGKDRPTAFETKPGSNCVLEVLKRAKP